MMSTYNPCQKAYTESGESVLQEKREKNCNVLKESNQNQKNIQNAKQQQEAKGIDYLK